MNSLACDMKNVVLIQEFLAIRPLLGLNGYNMNFLD